MEFVTPQEQQTQTPKWIPRLVVVGAIVLAIGYLFQLLTPNAAPAQPLTDTNFDESQSNFDNLVFTGTIPVIPERLPTALANEVKRVNQEIELALISKHRLQGMEQISGIWKGSEYGLTRTTNPEQYVLAKRAVEDATVLEDGINTERAIQTAETYVAEVFKNESLVPFTDRITYYEVGDHPHPEPAEGEDTANAIEISFGYVFEQYPIFLDKDYSYPVIFYINSDYEIQKMTFRPFFLEFQKDKSYETITIQQALGNIMDGKGSLIVSTYDGHGNPLLDQIPKGSFSGVSIEYRVDSTSKTLLPYYRFSGQLENNEGLTFYAEVITPAIQTEVP